MMQGSAYLKAGNYNQAVDNRSALNAETDASNAVGVSQDRTRAAIGAQLTAQGGSGFQMGTGTAADALAQSQVNGMLDALTIRRQGAAQAAAYQQQGVLAKMDASSKATASYFGAAQSLSDSATKMAAAGA